MCSHRLLPPSVPSSYICQELTFSSKSVLHLGFGFCMYKILNGVQTVDNISNGIRFALFPRVTHTGRSIHIPIYDRCERKFENVFRFFRYTP